MKYNRLSKADYAKIIKFIESIQSKPENYRIKVMILLSQIFGYHKSTSWIVDHEGNLSEPLVLNINEKIIRDYLKFQHYKSDVLHPKNVGLQSCSKTSVIRVQDLMSLRKFENTDYFKRFFCDFGLYHYLAIYLTNQNSLIGGIALLRSKEEKQFNSKDINLLSILSNLISKDLGDCLRIYSLENLKNSFECYANDSPIGLIVINEYLSIYHFNKAAVEICKELASTTERWGNPIEKFINQIITEYLYTWKLGLKKEFLSSSLNNYEIKILPTSTLRNSPLKPFYIFTLTPLNLQQKHEKDVKILNTSDLTIREREIITLIKEGYRNQDIANELFISLNTVKKHMQNIFSKIGVKNRTSLCYKTELNRYIRNEKGFGENTET